MYILQRLILVSCLVFSSALIAEQKGVSLRTEVSREVAYDIMYVNLYIEEQHKNATNVSSVVTETINKAQEIIKETDNIKFKINGRVTSPIYDKNNKITFWRERADISLSSDNFTSLSELIGKLTPYLKTASLSFGLSGEVKEQVENELILEAIAAFKDKASLITSAINNNQGNGNYNIISLNINSNNYNPIMRREYKTLSANAVVMSDSVVSMNVEGGTTHVQVSIDGIIDVLMSKW